MLNAKLCNERFFESHMRCGLPKEHEGLHEAMEDVMHRQLDEMRDLLSEARIRLDQHLGMCACPGEACVSACRECNTTQDLVNRIRAFMQGRT